MLNLHTDWWKALQSPYVSANEYVPVHIEALSSLSGTEFEETLLDLSDCIMHQYSFYPVTVAAVPHLVRLLGERIDLPEESVQLLSVLGYAVVCEAEGALVAAANATDFPLVEWYRASLVQGAPLVRNCIRLHSSVWNDEQKVVAALCSTTFHCSRRDVKVLNLLYNSNEMDECEVDECPHCGQYMMVNLADSGGITPREFTGAEADTGAYFHTLLMEMGEEKISQKVERLWGITACKHCGELFHLWDALLYC